MEKYLCRNCEKEVEVEFYETPESVHYGKLTCKECRAFIGWMKKPENEGKRQKSKLTPEYLGIDYCEICLRLKSNIGKDETLEVHHIIPIQEYEKYGFEYPGKDIRENILVVCTPCHRHIHWMRTYFNLHLR